MRKIFLGAICGASVFTEIEQLKGQPIESFLILEELTKKEFAEMIEDLKDRRNE